MFKTFCSVTFVIYFLRQTNNTVEVEWKLYLSNMISKNLDSQLFYVNQLANWSPVDRITPDLAESSFRQSSFHEHLPKPVACIWRAFWILSYKLLASKTWGETILPHAKQIGLTENFL